MARDDRLTHVTDTGAAHMVDIADKPVTSRRAEARGIVRMKSETLELIKQNAARKGDVLAVARVAGILGAKRTSELIPLCHGLPLMDVQVEFEIDDDLPGVEVIASTHTEGRTGVEMEALTAVAVASLTIYDMCKAVDRSMVMGDLRLTRKSGGRSGDYHAD